MKHNMCILPLCVSSETPSFDCIMNTPSSWIEKVTNYVGDIKGFEIENK